MSVTLFVLGGAGFIGREVVSEALAAGQRVKALVRTADGATRLREAGAEPVMGDARQPETWIGAVQGASTIIELLQPQLPRRLSRSAVRAVARKRQSLTQSILEGVRTLPGEQPVYFSISGADDLQPDERGALSHHSGLRVQPYGFGRIGIPVRKLVEASGHAATYVYLGNLVYGPGKIFADQYVAGLAAGRARIVGRGANRLPLTHVTDAARALVHLSQLPRSELVGRTYIAMDGSDATQRQLLEYTAACMGVKRPSAVPEWLGAVVAGRVAVETITLDAHADPSALLATGFTYRYPSYREGVPATLARLGRLADTAAVASGGHVA
jgi:nucleoside-diphosphate-sugar epimerase